MLRKSKIKIIADDTLCSWEEENTDLPVRGNKEGENKVSKQLAIKFIFCFVF